MTKLATIVLDAKTRLATDRYVDALMELAEQGDANARQLEEVRSYAAEFAQAIMRANPGVFPLVECEREMLARKAGGR